MLAGLMVQAHDDVWARHLEAHPKLPWSAHLTGPGRGWMVPVWMKAFLAGMGVTLGVLLLAGFLVVEAGLPEVAATAKDPGWQQWLLRTTRENAIRRRSKGIEAPSDLNDEARIATGAVHYDAMCRMCHDAPGQEMDEAVEGLNPHPPDLDIDLVQGRSDGELFWVVKHGVKMTGMPAFGKSHDDSELWALVAFIRKLPDLDAKGYASWVQRGGEEGHHHEGHLHEAHDDESHSTGHEPEH